MGFLYIVNQMVQKNLESPSFSLALAVGGGLFHKFQPRFPEKILIGPGNIPALITVCRIPRHVITLDHRHRSPTHLHSNHTELVPHMRDGFCQKEKKSS